MSAVVGRRVSIRWTGDPGKPWYEGKIVEFQAATDRFLAVSYTHLTLPTIYSV